LIAEAASTRAALGPATEGASLQTSTNIKDPERNNAPHRIGGEGSLSSHVSGGGSAVLGNMEQSLSVTQYGAAEMTTLVSARARRPALWYRSSWFDVTGFAVLAVLLVWLVVRGASDMNYAWQWRRLLPYLVRDIDGKVVLGPLVTGLMVTLNIAWISITLTLLIGLATAILRLSNGVVGRLLAGAYIELIRNTPLLLQILVFYFIIGKVLSIPRLWCGILTLAFYEGTFAAEIVRGAILSVRKGQWEASKSLGLRSFSLYRDVVLPQAVPLMIPPMTGVLVNLVKNSSIVSVIAIFDVTTEGRTIAADTFMSFEVWLTVAAMYLMITIPLSIIAAWLERRMAQAHQ
jgi:polar amino acid transport system permease protein